VHGTRALAHVPRSKPQQQPQDAHLEQRVADFVCAVGVRGVADQELEHFSISGFETNVFSYSRLVSISILSGCFPSRTKNRKKGFQERTTHKRKLKTALLVVGYEHTPGSPRAESTPAIMFRRLGPVAALVLAALPTLEVNFCV
jgi:hypothetical protein